MGRLVASPPTNGGMTIGRSHSITSPSIDVSVRVSGSMWSRSKKVSTSMLRSFRIGSTMRFIGSAGYALG